MNSLSYAVHASLLVVQSFAVLYITYQNIVDNSESDFMYMVSFDIVTVCDFVVQVCILHICWQCGSF
jgi:hypothetical protein